MRRAMLGQLGTSTLQQCLCGGHDFFGGDFEQTLIGLLAAGVRRWTGGVSQDDAPGAERPGPRGVRRSKDGNHWEVQRSRAMQGTSVSTDKEPGPTSERN